MIKSNVIVYVAIVIVSLLLLGCVSNEKKPQEHIEVPALIAHTVALNKI